MPEMFQMFLRVASVLVDQYMVCRVSVEELNLLCVHDSRRASVWCSVHFQVMTGYCITYILYSKSSSSRKNWTFSVRILHSSYVHSQCI